MLSHFVMHVVTFKNNDAYFEIAKKQIYNNTSCNKIRFHGKHFFPSVFYTNIMSLSFVRLLSAIILLTLTTVLPLLPLKLKYEVLLLVFSLV